MMLQEADACTGPLIGWPKSATFCIPPISWGSSVLAHVIRNIHENAPSDDVAVNDWRATSPIEELLRRGWLG